MHQDLGRTLIVIGIVLLAAGLLLAFGRNIPLLGRLPGDFRYQRDGFSFYFPLATCLVISLILSLVLRLFKR